MKHLPESDFDNFLKLYVSFRAHHYGVYFAYTAQLVFVQQLVDNDPSRLEIFRNSQAVYALLKKQASAHDMGRRAYPR